MSFMFSARCFAAIAIALMMGTGMAEEKRPNLVVIRFHSRSGQEEFQELSSKGIRFEKCLTYGRWPSDLASFLSGCHAFRATGGRETIRPDVPLLSEAFKAAGYRTAIFGEWGLGESLPFRPEDRGFMDFLVCGGPWVGSAQDRWGNREPDPWLRDPNGWSQQKGTIEGAFAIGAVRWLAARAAAAPEPFYLQVNLPRMAGIAAARVLTELKRQGFEDNTITVLIREPSPNMGPERDPSDDVSIHWPGHIPAGRALKGQTAAYDLFPTLAGLCRVPMFRDWKGDGIDLSKGILGDESPLPDRTFIQWAGFPRSESPDRSKSKNFIILSPEWRLEGFELLNRRTLHREDFETHEKVVSDLLAQYGSWWQSIRPSLVDPARVIVGDARQKAVLLNWSDWWPSREDTEARMIENPNEGQEVLKNLLETLADPEKSKSLSSISGHWKLHANQSGHYMVTLRKIPEEASEEERTRLGQFKAGFVHVRAGKFEVKTQLLQGATSVSLGVDLNEGPIELEAWTEGQSGEKRILGAFFATVERVGDRKLPDPEWKVQPK